MLNKYILMWVFFLFSVMQIVFAENFLNQPQKETLAAPAAARWFISGGPSQTALWLRVQYFIDAGGNCVIPGLNSPIKLSANVNPFTFQSGQHVYAASAGIGRAIVAFLGTISDVTAVIIEPSSTDPAFTPIFTGPNQAFCFPVTCSLGANPPDTAACTTNQPAVTVGLQ